MSLRPKYTLDRAEVQGDRYTINAEPFTQLTTRSYPYPRIGTRAPNGMFPKYQQGNGLPLPTGHLAPKGIPGPLTPKFQLGDGLPLPTGHLAPRGIPGPLEPKFQLGDGNPGFGGTLVRTPRGYVEYGPTVRAGSLKPHYMLDRTEVQGVMPASTYALMMGGKLTTEFTLPPVGEETVISAPSAPALFDYGTLFWGAVLGGLVTAGFVYGVIPALGEWSAAAIRKRALASENGG